MTGADSWISNFLYSFFGLEYYELPLEFTYLFALIAFSFLSVFVWNFIYAVLSAISGKK